MFSDTSCDATAITRGLRFSIEPYQCFHSFSFKPKQLACNILSSGKNIFSIFFFFTFLITNFKNKFYINVFMIFLKNSVCHLIKQNENLIETNLLGGRR